MGTSATIRVYEGDNTMGTPLVIDESNALDYVNNVKSLQFDALSEVLLEEVNEEITELPMPNEPTFYITEPGIMVEQNNAHDFVINFDIEGNHEWKLKLSVSENLTITGVTGDVAD